MKKINIEKFRLTILKNIYNYLCYTIVTIKPMDIRFLVSLQFYTNNFVSLQFFSNNFFLVNFQKVFHCLSIIVLQFLSYLGQIFYPEGRHVIADAIL